MFRKIILACTLLLGGILFAEVVEEHLAYFLGEPITTISYDTKDKGKYYTKTQLENIAKQSLYMQPFSLESIDSEDFDPTTVEKLKNLIRNYGKVEIRTLFMKGAYYTCKEGSTIQYFVIVDFL